jgi:hypothetical protein
VSTPITTELGFSYEYSVDINIGTLAAPEWQTIRFISAVDPQVTPVTQDAATYDDKGAPNQAKTGESWTLGFTVQVHRIVDDADGAYLPEVEALLALTHPDKTGNAAVGNFRWYDDPALGTPNKNDAFSGLGTVQVTRQNTGNDQLGSLAVTVTGQGRRTKITNPAAVTED